MPEEAVETIESTDPVVEAPVTDLGTESAVGEATETQTEAPDPFAEYGGADTVKSAHELYQATRSEEGVVQLFLEAGRALGLGTKEIEALFAAGETEPEEEEDDPDRPLTAKEFKEFQQKQVEQETTRQRQSAEAAAHDAVSSSLEGLGMKLDDPAAALVLQLGDRYMQGGDLSPDTVAEAVKKGHADYINLVDKKAREYLETKKEQQTKVPSSPAGNSAPAADAPAEPKNIKEAAARVREMLGLNK